MLRCQLYPNSKGNGILWSASTNENATSQLRESPSKAHVLQILERATSSSAHLKDFCNANPAFMSEAVEPRFEITIELPMLSDHARHIKYSGMPMLFVLYNKQHGRGLIVCNTRYDNDERSIWRQAFSTQECYEVWQQIKKTNGMSNWQANQFANEVQLHNAGISLECKVIISLIDGGQIWDMRKELDAELRFFDRQMLEEERTKKTKREHF